MGFLKSISRDRISVSDPIFQKAQRFASYEITIAAMKKKAKYIFSEERTLRELQSVDPNSSDSLNSRIYLHLSTLYGMYEHSALRWCVGKNITFHSQYIFYEPFLVALPKN
jgi:hypothetical protein